MRRPLSYLSFALLASGLIATAAKGAIDFTPTVKNYFSEGAEYSSVTFKDDKRTVSLTLPRQWTCRGDASRLQLNAPNQNLAEGVIQAVAAKGVRPFDEATVKALEQEVINTLPPGSHAPAVVRRQENPVILNQNLSYEFVVSYQTMGQTFQRSVIFVNCPDQQLIFRFSAPKATFENLNRSFRQSVLSWEWKDAIASAKTASTVASN
jgi:hypothetical protein